MKRKREPSVRPQVPAPETAEEMVNAYGTYNIQPTADTDNIFPTKGNLMNVKKSLQLARMGFDLLDRKRNILIRELMTMVDSAKALRSQISST